MKKYKLIKSLPFCKAGNISVPYINNKVQFYFDNREEGDNSSYVYSIDEIEANKEWFKEVIEFKVGDIVVNRTGICKIVTIFTDGNNCKRCGLDTTPNSALLSELRLATKEEIIYYYRKQGWVEGAKFKTCLNNTLHWNPQTLKTISIINKEVMVYNNWSNNPIPIKYCELVTSKYPKSVDETITPRLVKDAITNIANAFRDLLILRFNMLANTEYTSSDWCYTITAHNEKLYVNLVEADSCAYPIKFPSKEMAEYSKINHEELWKTYYDI